MDLSRAIDKFIADAHGDPVEISKTAADHRQNRNDTYEEKLLRPDYPGIPVDEILTNHLWPSPPEWLHMTVIELVHSKAPEVLEANAERAKPHAAKLATYALTFLPVEDSRYTYLHLRRDLANICADNGVEVASKYYNPSSHITFVRFANKSDLCSRQSIQTWIQKIKSINRWLKDECWPREEEGKITPGLRWIVGVGRGIEVRKGRLWYGDGKPVDSEEAVEH